jgi:hypothetical protein
MERFICRAIFSFGRQYQRIERAWVRLSLAARGGASGAQRLGMEAAHSAASLSVSVTNGGFWLTIFRHNVSPLWLVGTGFGR